MLECLEKRSDDLFLFNFINIDIIKFMKVEIIKSLVNNFESYANKTNEGIEFWLARNLQQLLGYTKWDNFITVISKAKTACEITKNKVSDHFADVGKTIQMPKGAQKEVPDIVYQPLQITIYQPCEAK